MQTLDYNQAVNDKLICESNSTKGDFPYHVITQWYEPSERHMFDRAVEQLRGCNIIILIAGSLRCIARGSSEVTVVEEK